MKKKPIAKLIGKDGNVFNLIGICSKALKNAGQETDAKVIFEKIKNCKSYSEAFAIMSEYCDIR